MSPNVFPAAPAVLRRVTAGVAVAVLALALGVLVVPAGAVDGGIEVSSSDMSDGEPLNPMFACTATGFPPIGGLISPQLSWSDVDGAVSYVVLMHDEFGANAEYDSPGDWAHWVTYNIDAGTTSLPRDASATDTLGGGTQGVNTWGALGVFGEDRYRGPCPPDAAVHDYYFTVYALDSDIMPTATGEGGAVTADDVLAAMEGNILDQGDLQVTFTNAEIGTNRADIELSSDSSDIEADGGNLPVLLINGVVEADTTVTVSLEPGSATEGTDFTFTSPQVVTIPAGTYDGTLATALSIPTLAITDDTDPEPDETFTLALSAPTGDAVIADANHDETLQQSTTFTIIDDDEQPQEEDEMPQEVDEQPPPPQPGDTLPDTGPAHSIALTLLGFTLVLVGALTQLARRSTRAAHTGPLGITHNTLPGTSPGWSCFRWWA